MSELWLRDWLPVPPRVVLCKPGLASVIEPEEPDPVSVNWMEAKGARLPLPLVRAMVVELLGEPVPG